MPTRLTSPFQPPAEGFEKTVGPPPQFSPRVMLFCGRAVQQKCFFALRCRSTPTDLACPYALSVSVARKRHGRLRCSAHLSNTSPELPNLLLFLLFVPVCVCAFDCLARLFVEKGANTHLPPLASPSAQSVSRGLCKLERPTTCLTT